MRSVQDRSRRWLKGVCRGVYRFMACTDELLDTATEGERKSEDSVLEIDRLRRALRIESSFFFAKTGIEPYLLHLAQIERTATSL